MKIREWDFNTGTNGAYVEREYPDAPIRELVEWMRNTRQWRESPEMVYQRWLFFERQLTEARNTGAAVVAPVDTVNEPAKCSATTKAGAPCSRDAVQGGTLCASHLRAAKAA